MSVEQVFPDGASFTKTAILSAAAPDVLPSTTLATKYVGSSGVGPCDLSGGTVLYNAHTGHEGTRQRGSSDFESYYETKLTLLERTAGKRTLTAEHREAEASGPFELAFRFDGETRTLRIDADEDELARKVREHLEQHPDASANSVIEATGGNRTKVLELVKQLRPDVGSDPLEPPGTTQPGRGGTVVPGWASMRPPEPPRLTRLSRWFRLTGTTPNQACPPTAHTTCHGWPVTASVGASFVSRPRSRARSSRDRRRRRQSRRRDPRGVP